MCHFAMGLTECYKTPVFLTFIFAVLLINLIYIFRQTLPAISAAEPYKNLAIANRSRVSCVHNTSRASMVTP